jgi:hypothetical protein
MVSPEFPGGLRVIYDSITDSRFLLIFTDAKNATYTVFFAVSGVFDVAAPPAKPLVLYLYIPIVSMALAIPLVCLPY